MISGRLSVRVVYNDFPKITGNMRQNADAICGRFAALIEGTAKTNIVTNGLVDTGAMLNSVSGERVHAGLWRVIVGQYYGVFHEFGTRFLPARPFLFPAFELHRAALVEAFRTGLVT